MRGAYYNEIDPYAAQWLRNLIAAGHIAPGYVDERDIREVQPGDLAGFGQCHFFAGIGGWSYALRLAGWHDQRQVWTGSCPCQPFSAAGSRKGFADERHLWPEWFRLIRECRPDVVFGEQVASTDGFHWLDLVCADLEGMGYACGPVVLSAAGQGAPEGRHRIWLMADAQCSERWSRESAWNNLDRNHAGGAEETSRPGRNRKIGDLANSDGRHSGTEGQQRSGEYRQQPQDRGARVMADPGRGRDEPGRSELAGATRAESGEVGQQRLRHDLGDGGGIGKLGDADGAGLPLCEREAVEATGRREEGRAAEQPSSPLAGFWSDAEWIHCTDGLWRAVEPGTFPLAHGVPCRVGKLRAYGNAIVPQVAAEVVRAYMELERL